MPAFGAQIGEDDRWDLINYIRALGSASAARILRVEPQRWRAELPAPNGDFAATRTERTTLKDFRGDKAVVLVLFDASRSKPRLEQLAAAHARIAAAGAEVVAVPLNHAESLGLGGSLPYPVMRDGDEEISAAYALFRHSFETWGKPEAQAQSRHVEFLIDRSGYLRARWLPGIGDNGWDDIDRLLSVIGTINNEPPAPAPGDHVH